MKGHNHLERIFIYREKKETKRRRKRERKSTTEKKEKKKIDIQTRSLISVENIVIYIVKILVLNSQIF